MASQPSASVRPFEAVVLIVAVLAGVALTAVLLADHNRFYLLGLLLTLVAVHGATRAVAPPAPTMEFEHHAQGEALARILDMRAKAEITTEEAERLLSAATLEVGELQLR